MSDTNNRGVQESKLTDHIRNKKELIPPLVKLGVSRLSWVDRLPEMLWAVLVIGNMEREKALGFFRHVIKFVEKNTDCWDITLTGISKFNPEKRLIFIEYLLSYSPEIKGLLKPLLLLQELPAFNDWHKTLDGTNTDEDWEKLFTGVEKTLWHQSQEATDCRWVKVMAHIASGKVSFTKDQAEVVRGIVEYPNYGDQRSVRPSIRAFEMVPSSDATDKIWSEAFWKECLEKTSCIPVESIDDTDKVRAQLLSDIKEQCSAYKLQLQEIHSTTINHFFNTIKTTSIDARMETSFGLSLYALKLVIEVVVFTLQGSVNGRLTLRALTELYITFAYLLKKENDEPKIWEDFRSYGSGKLKQIVLKLRENDITSEAIDTGRLEKIANEDQWVEFIVINLGQWGKTDLRKMSEEANIKGVYDKLYDYSSGYVHGTWGAIRESCFQKCYNPLHRLHNTPSFEVPILPNALPEILGLTNMILDCLSTAYPNFALRFKDLENSSVNSEKPPHTKPSTPSTSSGDGAHRVPKKL